MLSRADLHSPEIARLRDVLGERLESARATLEKDIDDPTTRLVRGRIRELKELLALIAPAKATGPHPAPVMGANWPDQPTNETWSQQTPT